MEYLSIAFSVVIGCLVVALVLPPCCPRKATRGQHEGNMKATRGQQGGSNKGKVGKSWEDLSRFWEETGRFWEDLSRFWEDLGRIGKIWPN